MPPYVIMLTKVCVAFGIMSSELNPDSLAWGVSTRFSLPYKQKEASSLLPRWKECERFLKSIEMKTRGKG